MSDPRNTAGIVKLVGIVLYDIVRSNIAVAAILVAGRGRRFRSGSGTRCTCGWRGPSFPDG